MHYYCTKYVSFSFSFQGYLILAHAAFIPYYTLLLYLYQPCIPRTCIMYDTTTVKQSILTCSQPASINIKSSKLSYMIVLTRSADMQEPGQHQRAGQRDEAGTKQRMGLKARSDAQSDGRAPSRRHARPQHVAGWAAGTVEEG